MSFAYETRDASLKVWKQDECFAMITLPGWILNYYRTNAVHQGRDFDVLEESLGNFDKFRSSNRNKNRLLHS